MWGPILSDFKRFYNIDEPLSLSWRRFMIYLSYLPVDKSSFFAPQYSAILNEEEYVSPNDTDEPEKGWWKKELDRRQGRRRPRDTMSLEQFMGEFNKK